MSTLTYNLYIRGLGRERNFDEIDRVWDLMRKLHFRIEKSIYNHTITAFSYDSNSIRCEKYFEALRVAGLTPDDYSVSSLLQSYYRTHEWAKAERLYLEAKEKKYGLGQKSFSVLMKMYGKLGDFERVSKFWDELKTLKIDFDTTFFVNALGGLGSKAPKLSLQFYNFMVKERVPRDWNVLARLSVVFKEVPNYPKPEDKKLALELFRLVQADPQLESALKDPKLSPILKPLSDSS